MKFRISALIEVVATIALGLAFARVHQSSNTNGGAVMGDLFDLTVKSALVGVSVAQFLRLLIERATGRSPAVWGWGRSAWCLSGAYHLVTGVCVATPNTLGHWSGEERYFDAVARSAINNQAYGQTAWLLVAYLILAVVARFPRDPAPDLREWSGRIYLVLVVLAWTLEEWLYEFGLWSEPFWGLRVG